MSSKKLKIFPYMLARVGGLPFSILKKFRISKEDYSLFIEDHQRELQNISNSEIILKGTVQTSSSFLERIKKYQNKSITSFRKKEFQTQRSVFQYLSRTVGKTSPFSTLTTLSAFHLEENVFQNIYSDNSSSKLAFNNQLFLEIKNWILTQTDLFQQLKLQRNTAIRIMKEEIIFYDLNTDEIKRIELSEGIIAIVDQLKQPKIFSYLIKDLEETIDAKKDELENYLFQLIEIGLLEWQLPDLRNEEDREEAWANWIKAFAPFVQQKMLGTLFLFLKNKKAKFKEASAEERNLIKQEIVKELGIFGLEEIPMKYIIYEDVATPCPIRLEKEKVESIISITKRFIEVLEPLIYEVSLSKLYSFLENMKLDSGKIGLLDLFEKYFQQDISENEIYQNEISSRRDFLKKEMTQLIKLDENGDLNFSLLELQKVKRKLMEEFSLKNEETINCNFRSGHFQFFEDQNFYKATLNGIASGHGKLFGRFVQFFPKEIIQNLKRWNVGNENDLWIQNDDRTIFNANSETCFFTHKINTGNSVDEDDVQLIALKDLSIHWDLKKRKIQLWHDVLKKEVKVFDNGVVQPSERSRMFQVLKAFDVPHISVSVFCDIVNELLEGKETSSVKSIPRISIDEKLIIQRKGKIIPTSFFPIKNKKDTRESFFKKVKEWQTTLHLPDLVFIKIKDTSNQNSYFSKPQLIDFNSPLSVLVFEKIINAKPAKILLEEMLPSEEHLQNWGGESFVTEFVVQWKIV